MIAYDFGKRAAPCGDCIDGHCTMNCGPSLKAVNENAPAIPSGLLTKIGNQPAAKAAVRYGKVRFA